MVSDTKQFDWQSFGQEGLMQSGAEGQFGSDVQAGMNMYSTVAGAGQTLSTLSGMAGAGTAAGGALASAAAVAGPLAIVAGLGAAYYSADKKEKAANKALTGLDKQKKKVIQGMGKVSEGAKTRRETVKEQFEKQKSLTERTSSIQIGAVEEKMEKAIQKTGFAGSGELERKKELATEMTEESYELKEEGLMSQLGKELGDIGQWSSEMTSQLQTTAKTLETEQKKQAKIIKKAAKTKKLIKSAMGPVSVIGAVM